MLYRLYVYMYVRFSDVWYRKDQDSFDASSLEYCSFKVAMIMALFFADNISVLANLVLGRNKEIFVITLIISIIGHWLFLNNKKGLIPNFLEVTPPLWKDIFTIIYMIGSAILVYFYLQKWFME